MLTWKSPESSVLSNICSSTSGAIAILAVISGADGWVAIETYGHSKKEWLTTFLSLPNGIPSHDTFARVFARINPQAFEQCFQNWISNITATMGAQVIPIDGKTLRGSYDREAKLSCANSSERMG